MPNIRERILQLPTEQRFSAPDDKAGVAEIIEACREICDDAELCHGKISICFTPDEEIGRGADKFDFETFDADFAYTVDGGELGGNRI